MSRKLRRVDYFRKRPIFLSNTSIIVTFIICGMWHGEPLNFVLWGFYQGIGLATLNVYQKQKRKIRNSYIKSYFMSKYSQWVGIIITFNFFVFGILLFSLNIEQIKMLLFRVL